MVVGQHGKGRTAALATDVAPHWVGGLVDWGDRRVVQDVAGGFIDVGNWYAQFFRNLLVWTGQLTARMNVTIGWHVREARRAWSPARPRPSLAQTRATRPLHVAERRGHDHASRQCHHRPKRRADQRDQRQPVRHHPGMPRRRRPIGKTSRHAVRHRRLHAGRRDRPGPRRRRRRSRRLRTHAQFRPGKLPPQAQGRRFPARFSTCSSKHDIRYYFLIGGNDTMDTIHRVEEYCREQGYELIGVGVPKTVDNDLFGTDHTPGFGSAGPLRGPVGQAGRHVGPRHEARRSVRDFPDGGPFGRLAAGGRARWPRPAEDDAPHIILLPERPFDRERFLADVKRCYDTLRLVQRRLRRGRLLRRRHADQRLARRPTSSPTSSSARWAAPARR